MATPTPPAPDQSHPDWLYLCIKYYVYAVINRFDLTSEHNTPILSLHHNFMGPLGQPSGFYKVSAGHGGRESVEGDGGGVGGDRMDEGRGGGKPYPAPRGHVKNSSQVEVQVPRV